MVLEKEFQNFLYNKGKLPREVMREAYELFYLGLDFSEIDFAISSRIRRD